MKKVILTVACLFIITLITAQNPNQCYKYNRLAQYKTTTNNLQFQLDSIHSKGVAANGVGMSPFYNVLRFQYDSLHRQTEMERANLFPPTGVFYFEDVSYGNPVNAIHKHSGLIINGLKDTIAYEYWKYDTLNRLEEYLQDTPSRNSLTTYTYTANQMMVVENFLSNGVWLPVFYKIHAYNLAGRLMSVLDSSFTAGQWRTTGNTDFYYSGARLDSSQVFLRNNLNLPFLYSKRKFFHDIQGNVIGDSLSNLNSNWMTFSANSYSYDTLYQDTLLATYHLYEFPYKIDTLKTWRLDNGAWLSLDSSVYYYSPISTVGLAEEQPNLFMLYPNPASNYLSYELTDANAVEQVYIYNTMSQLVYSSVNPATKQVIDISHLTHGTYFFVVKYKSNQFSTIKFIKYFKDE